MNAGLPGTGIGGAFYLLSALCMPFHGLYKSLRKKNQPRRMRLILVQTSMALGILGGIWLTGWLLGELREMYNTWLALKRGIPPPPPSTLPNVLKVTLIFLTVGLLAVVTGSVHILRLVMRSRNPRRALDNRIISANNFTPQILVDQIPSTRSRDVMVEKADVVC
jgi:hypothetical protein